MAQVGHEEGGRGDGGNDAGASMTGRCPVGAVHDGGRQTIIK